MLRSLIDLWRSDGRHDLIVLGGLILVWIVVALFGAWFLWHIRRRTRRGFPITVLPRKE